jgi:GNAT superfamily N-acetyltransferase
MWLEGTTRTGPPEIAEAIRSGGMLAAALEGRLAGCAYVRPLEAGTADLGLISAAPERWGSGVGRELVRSAEELMRSRRVSTMQLELLVPKGRLLLGGQRLDPRRVARDTRDDHARRRHEPRAHRLPPGRGKRVAGRSPEQISR